MARKRTLHADLRSHLVATTGHLLGEVPIAAMTTRGIARRAGVSDGVLYNHFADKNDLLVASLVERYATLLGAFEAEAQQVGDGNVESQLQAFARILCHLEAEALLLGAGLLGDPELAKGFWGEIHRAPLGLERLRRPLRTYLEAQRTAGRVSSSIDIDATITLVFGASAMVALARRLNPGADGATLDTHLDAAVSTLVRGL